MGKIDLEAVNKLKSTIKTNFGSVVREYKNKSTSISSKMDSVIRSYSEYSDVTSKASQIKQTAAKINSEVNNIERMTKNIVDGLKSAIDLVNTEENESKKIIQETNKKLQTGKIKDKSGSGTQKAANGLKVKESAEIVSQDMDQKMMGSIEALSSIESQDIIESLNDQLAMYNAVLDQYRREGRTDTDWLIEKIESLETTIKMTELQNNIQMYEKVLEQYRREGRTDTEWIEEKLKALYVDYQSKHVNNMSEEECRAEITKMLKGSYSGKTDINTPEGYEQAVMEFLMSKNLDIPYELLSNDPKEQAQILAYWVYAQEKGISLKENPMPNGWIEGKKKNFSVSESNYESVKEDAFEYYMHSQYIIDMIQGEEKVPDAEYEFINWYEQQYGHLDPESHETKRLKYLISKDLGKSLTNEQGLYDNEMSDEYKNAMDLWLNLYGLYDEYWKECHGVTNDKKVIKELIDKRTRGEVQPVVIDRNKELERLIISGEYRQAEDFIDRLDQYFQYDVKVDENGKITISVIMADCQDELNIAERVAKGQKVTRKEYTLNVDAFVYAGQIYLNSQEFDKAFSQFQQQRTTDGSYLKDLESINDSTYLNEAERIYLRWQAENPEMDISFDDVYAMLKAQTEKEIVYSDKRTLNECIQDAGQKVIDAAATVTALSGHPWVSIILQGGNVGIAGGRENYDEMTNRLLFLCLDGAIEISNSLRTVKILDKSVAQDTIQAISADDVADIIKVDDDLKVTLQDGTELIFKESQLEADDIIKLNETAQEAMTTEGVSSLNEIATQTEKQINDIADVKSGVDDIATEALEEAGKSIDPEVESAIGKIKKDFNVTDLHLDQLSEEELVKGISNIKDPEIQQKVINYIRKNEGGIKYNNIETLEKNAANELEAEVAAAVSNTAEVTEFNKNIDPIGQSRGGEIDVGTKKYIIEVTIGDRSKKASEFIDYFKEPRNPGGERGVILYAPNISAENAARIEDTGVKVITEIKELMEYVKE